MHQKDVVILTEPQRDQLRQRLAAGTAPARKLTHARILLTADQGPNGPGWVDERIAETGEGSQPTIARSRKPCVEEGLAAPLNRRTPRRVSTRQQDGQPAARLIALACRTPPAGQARWTLRLLADTLVALVIVEAVSAQPGRRGLNTTNSSPG